VLRIYRFVDKLVLAFISPGITKERFRRFILWAKEYPFAAMFVDLTRVPLARELLEESTISLGVPTAHPFGTMTTRIKVVHIKEAIGMGVDEMDVGLNYSAVKSHDYRSVEEEVKVLIGEAGKAIRLVFVPQTAILDDEEKIRVCEAIVRGGGKPICTSWGYGWNTTVAAVALLKEEFGEVLSIEAGGGIRTPEQATAMLSAGADRIHSGNSSQLLALDGIRCDAL
jgi:deoxyribose-phosphate aldolase